MRGPRSPALTLIAIALGTPLDSCATASLWQGDVAWNRDFELRADEFGSVDVEGIQQVDGELVLTLSGDSAASALAGWAPPGESALLALRFPPGSPIAALFGELPMLDPTRLEVRAVGRKPPPEGIHVLSLRARCELSGTTRDPRFVDLLDQERVRHPHRTGASLPTGLLGAPPEVRLERASVFDPALWSVVEYVEGELSPPGDGPPVGDVRRSLEVDLAMAPVAPPDPPLMLLFKVAATPLALAVDACCVVLLLFASGGGVATTGG